MKIIKDSSFVCVILFVLVSTFSFADSVENKVSIVVDDSFPVIERFSGVVYPDSVVADYYNSELVNFSFSLNFDMPRKVFVTPGILDNEKTISSEVDDLEVLYNRLSNASLICAEIEIYAAKVSQREYRIFSIHFIDDDMWYQVWVDVLD